jgi:hypothetical protein
MATSDDPEQKRRLYLMRAWSAQTEAEKEGDDNLAQRIDDFRTNLKAAPKFEDMDQFQAHISDVDQSLLTEMLARQPKPTKPNPT